MDYKLVQHFDLFVPVIALISISTKEVIYIYAKLFLKYLLITNMVKITNNLNVQQ